MDEGEFWHELRFRINSIPEGIEARRPGYCDWFEPRHYFFGGYTARILGQVGFVSGRMAHKWDFELFIHGAPDKLASVDWDTLLPPYDAIGWFSADGSKLVMELPPGSTFVPIGNL